MTADKPRDRWQSRTTFIIASVGAAVGLGNIWRFPFLMFKHGGGSFLIPYAVFLVVTGLPLLQAELALGRLFQKGDVMAFGSIHKRARGVGAISAVGGFGVVTYYSSIIAWAIYFTGASFKWPFPWAVEECAADDTACATDPTKRLPINAATDYFENTVLHTSSDSLQDGVARIISGPLFGTLLITWVFAYFCIWKGVASVGPAVKLTVVLPWMLLAIMIIYNATLTGSGDGVKAYIGEWDMDVLKNGVAWSDAAGQVFFTLGATLGIMSAYGSYAPASANVYADNTLICYINCFTSLMAGFAVFSILGNMAWRQTRLAADDPALRMTICANQLEDEVECPAAFTGCDMCQSEELWQAGGRCCGAFTTNTVAQGGIYLAFAVYPATMQFVSKGGANVLSILWFFTLWLLGIDSMFAMVEGVATVITDTPRFCHLRKETVAMWTCMLGFICSIAFITDIGFFLLDAFDHYILNFALMLTGSLEAYVVSWVWGWKETKARTGFASAAALTGGFTIASLLGVILAGGLHHAVDTGINIAIGVAVGFAIFFASALAAFFLRSDKAMSFKKWLEIVVWAGTRNLRCTFKKNPKRWETILHIVTFDFMIKYICFPALLGLFVNQAVNDAVNFDNGYGDYPTWVHVVAGLVVLGIMFFFLVIFVIWPGFWDSLGGAETEEEKARIYNNKLGAKEGQDESSNDNSGNFLPTLPDEDDWGTKAAA